MATTRAALMLFSILLASPAAAQTKAIVFGNLADAVSTELALQNGRAREGNPIVGNTVAQRIAVKTAGTLATVYLVKQLEKKNKTAARITGYAIAGIYGAVTVHNLRLARR